MVICTLYVLTTMEHFRNFEKKLPCDGPCQGITVALSLEITNRILGRTENILFPITKLFFFIPATYTFKILAIFFPVYFLLATWTYGAFVPSGLFVPCILTGAAWGRLFAVGLSTFLPADFVSDTCLYAVVGAAAFLGTQCNH